MKTILETRMKDTVFLRSVGVLAIEVKGERYVNKHENIIEIVEVSLSNKIARKEINETDLAILLLTGEFVRTGN